MQNFTMKAVYTYFLHLKFSLYMPNMLKLLLLIINIGETIS